MTAKKFYTAKEAADLLGYTHIESFRRAARQGWLKHRLNPIPGGETGDDRFHHNSLAYPVAEVDLAAGF